MIRLNDNLKYRTFVNQRDKAAEDILINSRLKIAEIMDRSFVRVIDLVRSRYVVLNSHITFNQTKSRMAALEHEIGLEFQNLAHEIYNELVDLRKKTRLLSYAGEFQAIHNVTTSTHKPKLNKTELENQALIDRFPDGSDPLRKILFELTKIKQKIFNALEMASILDEDLNKAIGRVYMALPKKKAIPKKAALKKVKALEAIRDPVFGLAINLGGKKRSWGFEIDPATWDALLDDYKKRYIPIDRSPAAVFDILNPWNDEPIREEIPPEEAFYAWEVERDITNDFVNQVRSGQIDAAKQNGIDEFVVISIIDDVTCEKCCGDVGCYDFHGKLTSEVEEMTDGNYSSPPYHFNCRCTIAPTSKDLEYKPEISDEEFDQWLNS